MRKEAIVPNEERDLTMQEAYRQARELLNYCRTKLPAGYHKRLALKKFDQFIRAMIPLEDATWMRHEQAQVPSEPSDQTLQNSSVGE